MVYISNRVHYLQNPIYTNASTLNKIMHITIGRRKHDTMPQCNRSPVRTLCSLHNRRQASPPVHRRAARSVVPAASARGATVGTGTDGTGPRRAARTEHDTPPSGWKREGANKRSHTAGRLRNKDRDTTKTTPNKTSLYRTPPFDLICHHEVRYPLQN